MSKSLGNSIEPNEICEKWGADSSAFGRFVEYQADVKMSERVMTSSATPIAKSQYLPLPLGNLGDFDPSKDSVANDRLEEMDRWMLERTADLVKKCASGTPTTSFIAPITPFTITRRDLSAFYYDVLKDRLSQSA